MLADDHDYDWRKAYLKRQRWDNIAASMLGCTILFGLLGLATGLLPYIPLWALGGAIIGFIAGWRSTRYV